MSCEEVVLGGGVGCTRCRIHTFSTSPSCCCSQAPEEMNKQGSGALSQHRACEFSLLPVGAVNGAEKPSKDGSSRGFRELKEALKILESLKNMTVEQLWTGGSPTSPTCAEPASTTPISTPAAAASAEKPTKEKRFLDDIKKLQENLRKTLDNVAIVEEEKMEAVVGAGGSSQGPEVG